MQPRPLKRPLPQVWLVWQAVFLEEPPLKRDFKSMEPGGVAAVTAPRTPSEGSTTMLAPAQKESAQLQPKDSNHICRLCKFYCTSKPQNVLCHQPYSDNYIPTRAAKPVGHDHNMSPASSPADSFQSKLAGYHPGSLDATSHSGLLPRSLSLPYTVKGTLRDTPPTRGELWSHKRYQNCWKKEP